jgi:hypothetical protein
VSQREGLALGESAALLAQLTAGLSSGQLRAAVSQLGARLLPSGTDAAARPPAAASPASSPGDGRHLQRSCGSPEAQPCCCPCASSVSEAALALLPGFAPSGKDEAQQLAEWTAAVHQPLPPEVRGKVAAVTCRLHGMRAAAEQMGRAHGLCCLRLWSGGAAASVLLLHKACGGLPAAGPQGKGREEVGRQANHQPAGLGPAAASMSKKRYN